MGNAHGSPIRITGGLVPGGGVGAIDQPAGDVARVALYPFRKGCCTFGGTVHLAPKNHPIWRRLLEQLAMFAELCTKLMAGSSIAARVDRMATTTKSSMSVKAWRWRQNLL